MTAIKNGVVPSDTVPPVDIPISVNQPNIARTLFVLQHYIRAVGNARFDNKVLAQGFRNLLILSIVLEQFIPIGIG